jgi:hypothetical protein
MGLITAGKVYSGGRIGIVELRPYMKISCERSADGKVCTPELTVSTRSPVTFGDLPADRITSHHSSSLHPRTQHIRCRSSRSCE